MITHRKRIGAVFGPVINWTRAFEFEVMYRTVVQQYRLGVEERESLRTAPRFRIDFTGHFMGEDAEDFIAEWKREFGKTWYFPLPFRKIGASASILIDPETEMEYSDPRIIRVDQIPFWAVVGLHVVVETTRHRELARIESIDPVTRNITFVDALTQPINRANMFASLPVRFEGSTALQMLTSDLYQHRVVLESVPGDDFFRFKPFVPTATLNGQPVVSLKANWRNGVEYRFDPAMRRSDFDFGRNYAKQTHDFVTTTRKAQFMFRSVDEFEDRLAFLNYCKGQRMPFWFAEENELLDKAPGTAANNRFYPTNKWLGKHYSGSKTHRNLLIQIKDGRLFPRQITEFQVASLPNYLGFAALPFGVTINDATHRQVCWLTLNRFAADNVVFDFATSSVGTYDMSIKTLATREVQS